MSRLVDYFVIVGFDHEKERGGLSSGVILQRFPELNWDDTPFHEGIEWFCQPQGWALSTERSEPRFYVSVLTDVDANRHYCACLCFNETVAITPAKPADEDEESLEPRPVANITHHSIMYAPKCLVIVSRQDYLDTFRNCLGIIYTVWVENLGVPLETLVGNLLGCVLVPPAGGPQVRFSIGAGDRQALQPPAAPPLPVTHTSVHMLLRLLGIHNSVTLWCAVMSEHKVLLVSLAAARLAAACRALAALMFPFRYAHVFIPLLPAGLAEVLATPTPFLIGVHSSLKEEVSELLDVIVADLDVGSLHIPAGVNIPRPDGKLLSSLQEALALVLQPELRSADSAFAPPPPAASPPHMLDKEIRAVFMRTLAKLLQGYRHCLTLIRIHPSPVLTFHKAGFLGSRGLASCPFAVRLLDSMFFNGLVAERGPPWRPTDIWDELVQNLPEQLRLESLNPNLELEHIQDLAKQLQLNENPNPQTYQQRILRPPEGASARIHQPPLPALDAARVKEVIEEVTARNASHPKLSALRAPVPRIVPPAAPPAGAAEAGHVLVTNSARRLEVLRACIAAIFECRYADARKSFPAVLLALRACAARTALVRDLAARLPSNKHLLHHHQFELLVRLMNCALQSASALDEHSVAAAMLPLATAYCRKLCTGVIQYAYMCIQEHQVWTSQQFWEAAFYQDVQRDIKALYLPSPTHHQRAPSPRDDEEYNSLLRAQEPSALEIAAEQMRLWPSLPPEKQREIITSEEQTLYSQAIHYANRMVYLLLPLEGAGRRADVRDDDRASNSITNSVAESDSADAESGFEEADPGEAGNNVIKMVSRFVDKVCTEGGVTADHVRCLHQMIPGVVHMHMEALDAVARESRRLPPVQKPRIVAPWLVPGEAVSAGALRCCLAADGRTAPLLPAEGALFLTNYRLVFRGAPHDPFANEQTVVRSFPLCALTREKAVRTNYLPHLEHSPQEGLQLRSATFQLIKVVLDEEVSGEQLELFRKQVARLRHPQHPLQHFALAPRAAPPPPQQQPKHHTLKGFAKKTLLKTARRAGLKPKPSKRQKYVLPSASARSLTSPPLMSSLSADTLSLEELELSGGAAEPPEVPAARTLERVRERLYARDWARLGLAAPPFRLAHANAVYTLCRRYVTICLTVEELELSGGAAEPPEVPAARTLERVRERLYARDWARLGLAAPPFRLAHANAVYTLCRRYVTICLTVEELELSGGAAEPPEVPAARTLERVRERLYARDWARLGLAAPPFRLAHANAVYTLCRRYVTICLTVEELELSGGAAEPPEVPAARTLERVRERLYARDWARLGLAAPPFRLAHANAVYTLCRRYVTICLTVEELELSGGAAEPPEVPAARTLERVRERLYARDWARLGLAAPPFRLAHANAVYTLCRRYVTICLTVEELELSGGAAEPPEVPAARTLERVRERLYARDWARLGLAAPPFRLAHANAVYTLCRRYVTICLTVEELELSGGAAEPPEVPAARTLERVRERLYARDWARLGLAAPPFRLAHANAVYTLCRRYVTICLTVEELELSGGAAEPPEVPAARTLERVRERLYARDWARLGLAAPPFRLAHANAVYTLCRRYVTICLTVEELELSGGAAEPPEVPAARTLERVRERLYARDWARLGLAAPPFRLAHANAVYTLCRRYVTICLTVEELELSGGAAEPPEVPAARTLERVRERLYARDWARLGLAAPPFRLAHANAVYTLCRSYPAVIPVPESIGDESLRRVARCYRQGRLPCVTWRHPRTHALLARSAASHHKGVMGMLKSSHQTQGPAQSGTETTSSLEQERYLATLVACTPASRGELEDSSLSLDSLLLTDEPTHTPLLTKPGTMGGGARHFGRWGSLKGRQPAHLDLYPRQRLSAADVDDVSGDGNSSVRRASLYIVTEKGLSVATPAGCEPVPAEYPDVRACKHAFKKLLRAAAPSAAAAPDDPGFYSLVEESGWLWQLRQLFQLSGCVVDLLDLQGSSVLLSLEDGWDVTAQISSLAQICLEPYYRTLEGFRTLIEKEWLAMGHKFQQRLNIGAAPQQGFTPTFLMFLDCVHQLQKQFPLAFEFNEYYTRFVAYHSTSCRFRSFLFDNECSRAELGLTLERRPDIGNRLGVETGAGSEEEGCVYGTSPRAGAQAHGQSLFDYIDKLHQKSPVFYNFLYTPDLDNPVLRPMSAVCSLEVWEYYTHEELAHGAPYDLEAQPPDEEREPRSRRTVTAGYDSICRAMPASFSGLLERIRALELELGHLPQKWRVRWEQLELPNTLELQRNSSLSSAVVRRCTLALHKRGTLELLARGRLARAPAAAPQHRWTPAAHAAPLRCDHCDHLLWGPVKTGVRCVDCGASCHERCADSLTAPCTRYKAPPPPERERDARAAGNNSVGTLQSSSQQYYEQFSSNVAENRTHEGHLYKRGALLKGWKQRWFVLDSIKHQLRYYDAMEDSHCKGFIDLAEVITVMQAPPAPGPPKKCDDRSFFDLRTSRRTYNFCASDANAAQEWIEKLQACLQ